MRLRSLLVFGVGIATGLALARRMRQDDPDVLHGPRQTTRTPANPAMRTVSGTASRIADRATVASLDAIRKARGAIRVRLGEGDDYDDALWN
jgi:hypothetical protein